MQCCRLCGWEILVEERREFEFEFSKVLSKVVILAHILYKSVVTSHMSSHLQKMTALGCNLTLSLYKRLAKKILNVYLESRISNTPCEKSFLKLSYMPFCNTLQHYQSSMASPFLRDTAEHIYGENYNLQIKILLASAFSQSLTLAVGWESHLGIAEH